MKKLKKRSLLKFNPKFKNADVYKQMCATVESLGYISAHYLSLIETLGNRGFFETSLHLKKKRPTRRL